MSSLDGTQKETAPGIGPAGGAGLPLAPWTYSNAEFFELEYRALFLRRWQFVGHVNDLPESGSFLAADIGRDNVLVVRGKDMQLRAFANVCRHRASRLLEGRGTCRGVIRCPYHGWTYRLDGTLMVIPRQENFPGVDLEQHGLHEWQLEVFHGLVFVRAAGDGPGVQELFAHTAHYFQQYDVASQVSYGAPVCEVWEVNWKIAWDNYLENYHIPVAHPGLNRLLIETDESEELPGGVSYGTFTLKSRPSSVPEERLYQEQFRRLKHRVAAGINDKWVQFGLSPNLGIDLYPEMLDFFQLVPLGPRRTLVRAAFYAPANATAEEIELRRLNRLINDAVNAEDRQICQRVQQGLRTHEYQPGPFSAEESGIARFHDLLRAEIPVASLRSAPPEGTVAAENERMLRCR